MSWSHTEAIAGINLPLTSIARDPMPKDEVWFDDFVAPDFVNKGTVSGQIRWLDQEDYRSEQNTVHEVGKPPPVIDLSHPAYRTYTLEPHSLGFVQNDVEDSRIRQGGDDPNTVRAGRVTALRRKLVLSKHVDLYNKIITTGNYPATCVIAASAAWSGETMDAPMDVKGMRTAVRDIQGVTPFAGVMNDVAFDHLKYNPAMTSRMGSDKLKVLDADQIRTLLGLDYLHVTNARYDTGRKGDTSASSRIWGAYFLLFYRPAINPRILGEMEFMRTIRKNAAAKALMVETKNEPEKSPSPMGQGYFLTHNVKQGFWGHELITVDDVTTPDTVCAALLTGIY